MQIKTVLAKLSDCEKDLLDLSDKSFPKHYDYNFVKRLKGKKYWICLVRDKDRTAGYKIWYEEGDDLYSWLGAILPEYRRKGLASRLMDRQFKQAKQDGYHRIWLKTEDDNEAMLGLCNKKGLKEFKRVKNHWGDGRTAVFLEKIF